MCVCGFVGKAERSEGGGDNVQRKDFEFGLKVMDCNAAT